MANEILSMVKPIRPANAQNLSRVIEFRATKSPVSNETRTQPEGGANIARQGAGRGTPTDDAELQQAVSQINQYVQSVQRDLLFSMDNDSGRTVITVMDSSTGEKVRQIPSEEVLALATHFVDEAEGIPGVDESFQGLIFSEKV